MQEEIDAQRGIQLNDGDPLVPRPAGRVLAPRQETMGDMLKPTVDGGASGIVYPAIRARQFELRTNTLQFLQANCMFDGLPSEDPGDHVATFLRVCDTFKISNVSEDAIRLRAFPFTLRGKARDWLKGLPAGSITTWDQLADSFMVFFYSPA